MGNCVDKFIDNRVNKRLSEILDVRLQIHQRSIERDSLEDYFNSVCYEQDFADIRKLRDIAKELELNCNNYMGCRELFDLLL